MTRWSLFLQTLSLLLHHFLGLYCYGIRGARSYPDFFTYWNVRMAVDQLQTRTHGTIFDTITRQTFKLVDTVIPPAKVAKTFEGLVSTLMHRILRNLHEGQVLTDIRDTLLPKLVSGELRVGRPKSHANGGPD